MGFIPTDERILTNKGKYFIAVGLGPTKSHQAEEDLMKKQKELGALINAQKDLERYL